MKVQFKGGAELSVETEMEFVGFEGNYATWNPKASTYTLTVKDDTEEGKAVIKAFMDVLMPLIIEPETDITEAERIRKEAEEAMEMFRQKGLID
jgi:hypothetical protein